jgi:hypothetical protein
MRTRRDAQRDRQSWTLEDKLPELLQELETRRRAGGAPAGRRARGAGAQARVGGGDGACERALPRSTCAARRYASRSPSGSTSSRSAPTATRPRRPTAACPRRPSGSRGRAATPTLTTRWARGRAIRPPLVRIRQGAAAVPRWLESVRAGATRCDSSQHDRGMPSAGPTSSSRTGSR